MDFKIDLTAQIERLRASLFCICNTPKTQRFACGHSFCPACNRYAINTTSCGVCKETELVEGDADFDESKNYTLGAFRKILGVLGEPPGTNPSDIKMGDYEVFVSTPFKCNRKGESPLHLACKTKDLSAVRKCIRDGHSLNCKDYAGWTPLHEAVESDFTEGVRVLLEASALCDVPGDSYATPLHKAVVKSNTTGDYSVVELLKKFGADVNARDYSGQTPLDLANETTKEILLRDTTPETTTSKKVFLDRVVVSYKNIKPQRKRELLKISEVAGQVTEQTTHLIIEDESNRAEILMGVLFGVIVTNIEWLDDFIESNGKKVIANTGYFGENENNRKSALNRLLGRPRLFDGVNFYLQGHHKELLVDGMTLMRGDLIGLIKASSGRLLSRCPTPGTATQVCVPYHASDKHKPPVCSNYVIYDDKNPPELQYNMQEIKHKPAKWLIDCVSNFRIV